MNTATHIMGIGVDVVHIKRVAKVLRRHPLRFPNRLLHGEEYGDYRVQRDPSRFLARRFAAKEAIVKALGLGFAAGAYASRIRVEHDAYGCPHVVLPSDLPHEHSGACCKVLLSIADEKEYVVAQAIALQAHP